MSINNLSGNRVRWLGLLTVTLLLLVLVAPSAALVDRDFISGLVYIDANENGEWDVGEQGYGGVYGVAKEGKDWVWRYRGTDVTFTSIASGPEDPYIVESAPFREMEKGEENGNTCTRQDYEDSLDEGFTAARPCEGTFGMISWADDVTWEVTIDVPEGYELTSDSTLRFATGTDVDSCDFGIVYVGTD
jgi:hypothetical protein